MKIFFVIAVLLSTVVSADDFASSDEAGGISLQEEQDREDASEKDRPVIIDNDELRTIIEQAVAKRVRPLEREIADLKETIRLHDILGGIGFIMGLAGITFYFLGVRRRDRMKSDRDRLSGINEE